MPQVLPIQGVPVAEAKADDLIAASEAALAQPLPALDVNFTAKDAALITALNAIATAILALVKKR